MPSVSQKWMVDEPTRIGYVFGSCPGHADCTERLLLLEHDADDSVWLTVRSIWRSGGSRWPFSRGVDQRQRRLDAQLVKALHPSNAG